VMLIYHSRVSRLRVACVVCQKHIIVHVEIVRNDGMRFECASQIEELGLLPLR
jgi:hypothetical protein